jgi:O-succinylbenzoic acid--CoA ligase
MPELVAVALPGGPAFVDAVQRIWDAGDAILPVDPTAPPAQLDLVLGTARPARFLDESGLHPLADALPVESGDAVVITTSGSTGTPRAAVITHDAVEAAAYATSTALGVAADTHWLACLPLHHVGGCSVITRALHTGAGLDVIDRADPVRIEAAAAGGATHVSLVPTALARIDPARWRVILLGGSAAPADRPANVVATYGMTETFGGVVYDGLPLNGVGMRVAGEPGAPWSIPAPIELRTPSLMRCYRDGTQPASDDGWYRTGDLGTIDPATGLLSVAGRADDLIITGGENIWPTPVEAALSTHPQVAQVAVAGRPDPEWGQRVVAWVVPVDPRDPPTLDALRVHAKTTLPAPAAPRELVLVDSLPRTPLGKIVRHRLGGSTSDDG